MELELKKLEDLSEAIVNDFAYMRAREEQMRDTNGKSFPCFWIIILWLYDIGSIKLFFFTNCIFIY